MIFFTYWVLFTLFRQSLTNYNKESTLPKLETSLKLMQAFSVSSKYSSDSFLARNHPLLKHYFRINTPLKVIQEHNRRLKAILEQRQRQIEEERRNQIYLKTLAKQVKGSFLNDLLPMRYL